MTEDDMLREQLQRLTLASPFRILTEIQYKMREVLSSIMGHAQVLQLQIKEAGIDHSDIHEITKDLYIIGQELHTFAKEISETMTMEVKDITQADIQSLFQGIVPTTRRLVHTRIHLRQSARSVDALLNDIPLLSYRTLEHHVNTIIIIVSMFSGQSFAVIE